MDKKTALVTGAIGFTGWHMVHLLLEKDYHVIATDLQPSDDPLYRNVEFIALDLLQSDLTENDALLDALRRTDYVFHIAGLFNYTAPALRLFDVNVGGTQNLLNAISACGHTPRLVVWGAAGVFGNFDHIPLPATEDMPPQTSNPYLVSKLAQERVALLKGKIHSIPTTVIRPSAVYGPRSRYGMALSITTLLKTKVGFVIGGGKNKGALVHVRDIARAAEFLARNDQAIGEVYHITDDTPYTTEEITRHLVKACGGVFIPVHIPRWLALKTAGLAKIDRELIHLATINAWISNEKIKKLGFQFSYPDSKIGLTETVEWYKANPR